MDSRGVAARAALRDREGKDEPASHWCRTRSDIEPSTRISNDVDDGSPSCDTE